VVPDDGSFSTIVNGPNGLQGWDKRFGMSAGGGGFEGLRPGLSAGEYQAGNVEYFTFSQNVAATADVTVSSDGGTASASAVCAQSSTLTFAIDFTTGAIHATQSDLSVAATRSQVAPPASSLSILA
jgi:hypothetical protein